MKDRFRLSPAQESHGRMWSLYAAPLRALLSGWFWKVPLGVVVAGVFQWFGTIGERYEQILNLPPLLIQIVVTLWLVDLIAGVYAAIRDDGVDAVSSVGIRQTIIKFTDYAIALFSATIFSGVGNFVGPLSDAFYQIPVIVAVVIAATELRSIDENLRLNFIGRIRSIADFGGLLSSQDSDTHS